MVFSFFPWFPSLAIVTHTSCVYFYISPSKITCHALSRCAIGSQHSHTWYCLVGIQHLPPSKGPTSLNCLAGIWHRITSLLVGLAFIHVFFLSIFKNISIYIHNFKKHWAMIPCTREILHIRTNLNHTAQSHQTAHRKHMDKVEDFITQVQLFKHYLWERQSSPKAVKLKCNIWAYICNICDEVLTSSECSSNVDNTLHWTTVPGHKRDFSHGHLLYCWHP